MSGSRAAFWMAMALGAIMAFALAPLLLSLLADLIAERNNCILEETSINRCMVLGSDWGETLYAMFVAHWYGLITLPLGAAAFGLWVMAALVLGIIFMVRGPSVPPGGQ